MKFTIFTGSDAEANREELFRRTTIFNGPLCVVVPDSRSVDAMQRYLVRNAGGAFLGHRVFTFEGLAHSILEINGKAPELLSPYVRRAVVSELIGRRIAPASRYAGIAGYPGFVTLFISRLEELRSRMEGGYGRDGELAALDSAYESALDSLGLDDHEGLVHKALGDGYPEFFADHFGGAFLVDGFYDLTGKQQKLVGRLVRAFSRSAATVFHDPERPGLFRLSGRLIDAFRSYGGKTVPVPAVPDSGCDAILRFFHAESVSGGKPRNNGSIEVHSFRNTLGEADWLAGHIRELILKDCYSPEDIMLVTRTRPSSGDPIVTAFMKYGIPVEGAISRCLKTVPVVRFALNALDAAIHPADDELLKKVQRSVFTAGKVSGGRDLLSGIDEKGWSLRIAELDTPDGYVSSLKAVLDDLGVFQSLENVGDAGSFADIAAYERLLEALDEFAKVYSSFRTIMRAEEFATILRDYLSAIYVPMKVEKTRGVLLTDINHARFYSRDLTVMTGLLDSAYPRIETGYTLLDSEDEVLVRQHRAEEEPLLFYAALAGAKRCIFTFPGLDDEGQDGAMSPYLRDIMALTVPSMIAEKHAAVPGASWEGGPRDSTGAGETFMRSMVRHEKTMETSAAIAFHEQPWLEQKAKTGVSNYLRLGTVPGVDLSLSPFNMLIADDWRDRMFSVTQLESYINCPLGFYFRNIVGLKVEQPLPGEIDAQLKGIIVHDVLADFFKGMIALYGNSCFDSGHIVPAKQNMGETVDSIFDSHRHAMTGIHPVTLLTERQALHAHMEQFVEVEFERFSNDPFVPVEFEVTFGGRKKGEERTFDAFPLESSGDDSEMIFLIGRIDRIDSAEIDGDEFFRVIDYKTGYMVTANMKGIMSGKDLQAPLYLEAVKKSIMPEKKRYDAALYSLRDLNFKPYKDGRKPLALSDWDACIERAKLLARTAAEAIRQGVFPVTGDECKDICDYYSICRGGCHGTATFADLMVDVNKVEN